MIYRITAPALATKRVPKELVLSASTDHFPESRLGRILKAWWVTSITEIVPSEDPAKILLPSGAYSIHYKIFQRLH